MASTLPCPSLIERAVILPQACCYRNVRWLGGKPPMEVDDVDCLTSRRFALATTVDRDPIYGWNDINFTLRCLSLTDRKGCYLNPTLLLYGIVRWLGGKPRMEVDDVDCLTSRRFALATTVDRDPIYGWNDINFTLRCLSLTDRKGCYLNPTLLLYGIVRWLGGKPRMEVDDVDCLTSRRFALATTVDRDPIYGWNDKYVCNSLVYR